MSAFSPVEDEDVGRSFVDDDCSENLATERNSINNFHSNRSYNQPCVLRVKSPSGNMPPLQIKDERRASISGGTVAEPPRSLKTNTRIPNTKVVAKKGSGSAKRG